MSRPPGFTRRLLELALPRDVRGEAVLGDLEEEFRDREERTGRLGAAWWYRRQAWRVLGRYAVARRRSIHALARPSPSDAARRSNGVEALLQDLHHGVRQLVRSPWVSALVVAALGLGIGANTAIFSAIDAVLLRPLPFEHPDRVVQIMERRASLPDRVEVQLPVPDFRDYEEAGSFTHVAAIRPNTVYMHEGDRRPERGVVHFSSALLEMMGVRPALGRGFTAREDQPDPDPVALLSHGYWQRQMGGDSTVLGSTLTLSRWVQGEGWRALTAEIVGVMPEGFRLPAIQVGDDYRVWGEGEVFLPMGSWTWGRGNRGMWALRAVAELAPGVSPSAAAQEVAAIARGISESDPENAAGLSAGVASLKEIRRARHGTVLGVLWAASTLILLVVCANVASLLLGRALARERELAVRTSLGASRGRLLRQLLAESVVLGAAGAAAGLVLAHWGAALLKRLTPGEVHGLAEAGLDPRVLLFAGSASVLTILVFGLGPAVRGTRTHPAEALRSGGRRGIGGGLRPMRWLVVGQVSLSLALLVGSGLLVRSLASLLDVDPGFDTERTIRVVLTPPPPLGEPWQNEDRWAFYEAVRRRLGGVPGVEAVGAGRVALLAGGPGDAWDVTPADRPRAPSEQRTLAQNVGVLPGFLDAVGTPLLLGRSFGEEDARRELEGNRMRDPWAGIPVLVNQSMARRFWGEADPLGKRFYWGSQDPEIVEATLGEWSPGEPYPDGWDRRYPPPLPLEIVGVVGDMRSLELDQSAPPTFYQLNTHATFALYVRTTGDPDAAIPALRSAVESVDPGVVVAAAEPLSTAVRNATAETRFQAVLLTVFASLAVFMTGLGLFGVLAYAVSRRTHEVAVRMSLGARRAEVSRMIVRDGLLLGVPGIALGLGLSLFGARFLSSLLFDVSTEDPLTFAGSTVLVLSVVLAACWWPAARATRVEPMEVLREE